MTWSSEINNKLKTIEEYRGTFPRDQLPVLKKFPSSLIMNTHPSTMKGEHWVAVYINKSGFGEYFDPYGFEPLVEEFKEFMNKSCPDGWTYNNEMIQGLTSVKCGQFCVCFVYLRCHFKFTMKQIVKLFSKNLNINDVIIDKIYRII